MLDNKFFFSLIGIMVAVFAMCNLNFTPDSKENWWNQGSKTVQVIREIRNPDGSVQALQNNLQGGLGNDKFISTPSFQGALSPRFSNMNYGANIKYNTPDHENLAVPTNPLTFGNMINEGYTGSEQIQENFSSPPTCGKGGVSATQEPSEYTSGTYQQEMQKVWDNDGIGEAVDALPVGNMTTINALGETIQPIVYDRYIFANRHSRLRSQGDPIRGDLAIVPDNNGWFNVSVNPVVDLQEGAMNVMGGVDNKTSNSLSKLIFDSSGNTINTLGGVDLEHDLADPMSALNLDTTNMATNYGIDVSSGAGGFQTVNATAYP